MPRSPPQTQMKPVLRFRNVWLTLNKAMLCFYTSCFQLSFQAEIQKYGRQLYICTISGPAETRKHWKSHKNSFAWQAIQLWGSHTVAEYNVSHVISHYYLFQHLFPTRIILINKLPRLLDTCKPHFYFTVAGEHMPTLTSFYVHSYWVIGIDT